MQSKTHAEYLREWGARNKDKRRNNSLRFSYGISLDDYNKLFAAQNGKCAICNKHQSREYRALCVDHNHATNKIRGLLCNNCNKNLGILENKTFCLKATIYLQREVK